MLDFKFRISNPWPKERNQIDFIEWNRKLSETWSVELQISRWTMDDYFLIDLSTKWWGCDHAGPKIYIELLGFMFNLKIYNTNHWNYETNTWDV